MKTSNKILLGLLSLALFIFVSLHATLYFKYKAGNYSSSNDAKFDETKVKDYQFENIKYVILENVSVHLYNSDTTNLQVTESQNKDYKKVEFAHRGDSLFVQADEKDNYKTTYVADLFINKNAVVIARNTSISMQNTGDSVRANSFNLILDNTSLNIDPPLSSDVLAYINTLKIMAKNKSTIDLNNTNVSQAEFSLDDSRLYLNHVTINRFQLQKNRISAVSFFDSEISWLQR